MNSQANLATHAVPWNKGKLSGQKLPLRLQDIWAIRVRLQLNGKARELALFDLGLDSKLRACDLLKIRLSDISTNGVIGARACVMQQKTQRPVQFELTEPTRIAVAAWVEQAKLSPEAHLFPSRTQRSLHLSTRQYSRILHRWVEAIGLPTAAYGTHSMRRTKVTLIYRKTQNLRAIQLLLGHTKLESTVRYLGVEVGDALVISEQMEI